MSPCQILCQPHVLLRYQMSTHHRVNQLHSVVFRGIVTGCNHDPNGGIALLRTERGDETNSEDDMV